MSDRSIATMLRAADLAPLDARALLRHVLGAGDVLLVAHPEQQLTEDQHRQYLALVGRRLAGEPVAYLTGEREFYSLAFSVTPDVLIPRPDTELLVEVAIERAPPRPFTVLDLGTGSGCVAIAIAKHCAHARVTATDLSNPALALARANAARHGVDVEFIASRWFDALPARRFDMIVANPPYVAAGDPHLKKGDVRFEPRAALVGGATGYECLDAVIAQAPPFLNRGGWLLLEHGHDQAAGVRARLAGAGLSDVFSAPDLGEIERISGGQV